MDRLSSDSDAGRLGGCREPNRSHAWSASNRLSPRLVFAKPRPVAVRSGWGRAPYGWGEAWGCLGSRLWPSTTAAARSISLRLSRRDRSRSIANAASSSME
jgi:hypothetical protein